MSYIPFRDDRSSGNYPQTWPTQTQTQSQTQAAARPRIWLEISDDEDSTPQPQPPFKPGRSKTETQVTPPLDLSGNTTKKGRQPESPLDLSVKTRKRHADTTDLDEAGILPEGLVAKRMCLNQMDYLQGGRRYIQEEKHGQPSHGSAVFEPKQLMTDSMLRSKMMQGHHHEKKYSTAQRRSSPMAQTSPMAVAQQQYQVIQRHHQLTPPQGRPVVAQQGLFQTGFDSQRSQQQSHAPPHPSPQPQAQQSPMLQKKQMPYESLSSPIARSVSSNSTESVALQGFFEPTCKVTVNTASSVPPISEAQQRPAPKSHIEQAMMTGPPNQNMFAMGRTPRDMPSPSEARNQQMYMHGSAYPPNSAGRLGRVEVPSRPQQTANELELIQQHKQSEHQRQLQQLQRVQRVEQMVDNMAYMSQMNKQKMMMSADRQQRMVEMMKQTDAQSAQLHSQNKGPVSPYSTKLHATYTQSTSGHPGVRSEDAAFGNGRYIRASQPVPLSDISKQQGSQEQPQIIQNPHNVFGVQSSIESARYAGYRHGGIMASVAEGHNHSRQMQSHMSERERERRYHIPDNAGPAGRPLQAVERIDPLTVQAAYTHPSVIQRPAGFIPPRIVSGGGRSNYGQSSSQVDKMVEHSLQMATARDRYSEKRDSLTIDNPFSDGVQMKKSQGISSPRAPFIDKVKPRPIQQDTIRTKTGDVLRPSGTEYHRSSSSSKEQMLMNRERIDYRRREHSSGSMSSHSGSRANSNEQRTRSDLQQNLEKMKQQSHNSAGSRSSSSGSASSHTQGHSSSVNSKGVERSITKGTSGVAKRSSQSMDLFSQIVMNELQKKSDDSAVNPFKNVSLLQEFDKSANTSQEKSNNNNNNNNSVRAKTESPSIVEDVAVKTPTRDDTFKDPLPSSSASSKDDTISYTLPLQIAIPGSKPAVSASRTSVISSTKQEPSGMKTPKIMSRKAMILSAFKNDEDRKNSATNSQDDKSVSETVKTPSASKRSDKESNPSCPPSPKMPILSPQDRGRPAPLVSPAIGDPPKLEDPAASNANTAPNPNAPSIPAKKVFSLEEQLHRLISDAVKGSVNKDKESVYETVRRELTTQPQTPKVFLSRQLSQTRNIPVANVAPIVHGKVISDTGEIEKTDDQKMEHDLDEDDAKMAEVVTMSLLGRSLEKKETFSQDDETETKLDIGQLKHSDSTSLLKDSIGECSNSSANLSNFATDSLFDENSNSKRLSPGLKKLMLYRHRDVAETSTDDVISVNDVKTEVTKAPEVEKEERNVFGALNEILAQRSGAEENEEEACWPGLQTEDVEHKIHMVPNTDYDGDDEDYRLPQKIRRCRQSNVKQQADRLIKKAKHRRSSKEGGILRGRRLSHRRGSQRGFVDFKPQVLPRRTRSTRHKGKSPTRRKSRVSTTKDVSPARQTRRKSSHETKTRQRRASSLDRETKANNKAALTKGRQTCFSDNELDLAETCERSPESSLVEKDASWNQNDESTDEEYFQNYEDEFKEFAEEKTSISSNSNSASTTKKTPGPKRKKGFHFQQKYIFQRKRKSKNRAAPKIPVADPIAEPTFNDLDQIYSFHEEGQDLLPYASGPGDVGVAHSNIPVPPEIKRISVNKDTGETLLHRAARMGYVEVALYCLATGTVDVNARDNAGYTALHECAVRGRVEIAKYLLKHGSDVNCCSVDGIRPIHDAVENDQLEMVRILLSFGADPTLSTYAGRSLIKIARTDRMRRFLKAYVCDLNGHSTNSNDIKWQFKKSCVTLEPEDDLGCAIFKDVPSDPEDETSELLIASNKPLFTTRRLTIEATKRVEDYILLDDMLQSYRVTRAEIDALNLPSHLLKSVSTRGLMTSHADSVFRELFERMVGRDQIPAVRMVDAAQVISRLEKPASVSSKRSKI